MWSKRAETRKQNMTSFRSKITRRKRKLSHSRGSVLAVSGDVQFLARRVLDGSVADTVLTAATPSQVAAAAMKTPRTSLPAGDVTDGDCITAKANPVPVRYSDTYVASINNRDKNTDKNGTLRRSHSRNGGAPTRADNARCDNDHDNMQYSLRLTDHGKSAENKRSVKNKKKQAKSKQNDVDATKKLSNTQASSATESTVKPADNKKKKTTKESENNSYLKRVKSKIYKSRSDSSASVNSTESASDAVDTMTNKTKPKKIKDKKSPDKHFKIPKINEDIFEDEVQLRKPNMPMFLRQSSNLERVRPRTFGLRTSASNVGISDLVDSTTNILNVPVEKPKLMKSKSSSAINLNLLRTRRSKLLDQSRNSSKNAAPEFDFITWSSGNASVTLARKFGATNLPVTDDELDSKTERPSSWIFGSTQQNEGDRQPGQPVSRSSSDKRPDAVTEEVARPPDSHDADNDADTSHDNLHNVQRAKSSQPAINRSESYKEQSQKRRQIRERRKISDPNLSKSNDVDSDHQELSYHSGSSSNSSLSSSRSSESPQSTSLDTVPGSHTHSHHAHHHHGSTAGSASTTAWDSDVDIEPDPPDWQSSVSEDVLSRLHPEEKKRQEVINELFHTERSHVRNLRVLETVFYRPLLQNKCLPHDQVRLLFPNLEEMLEIHGAFNAAMKARRKEEAVVGNIGELLLNMFDGTAGETFQQAAAKFCARQQLALESLKEKRRKDPRLHSFLTDCESDKLCKRLQLKDIIPTGMQRLVKYPLLFESLARCTERVLDSTMTESLPSSSPSSAAPDPQAGPTPTELARLRRAVDRSKEILNYVNQAVKEAEDKARLQDLQKRLDKTAFEKVEHPIASEFRNLDLTKHKLIHEGPLLWRLNKQNKLSVHVVLLEEVILLLQKQDEKYILKFYSFGGISHSPIVKVSTVLVRHNATEKESLYLVNTAQNGAQIYDLSAQSPSECKIWFKHISDAAEAYKSREGKSRRPELSTPEPDGAEAGAGRDELVGSAAAGDGDKSDATSGADTDSNSNAASGESSQRNSSVLEDEPGATSSGTVPGAASSSAPADKDKRLSQAEQDHAAGTDGSGAVGNSKREAQMRLATEDQPLIQPSEVTVNVLPVHTAQPVVTPIEQVRRKDEAIRQALAEKEALVAEILQVPPEDYHTIADMAGDISGDKEPTELVLAAVNQANQLLSMVSESLNITDADTVLATSSQNPSCTSSPPKSLGMLPSIPSHSVQNIASTLNTQLTALLKVVKEREDERERMRRELQKLREQLHVMHETQQKGAGVCSGSLSADASCADPDIFHSAGDLANIEEDP